MLLPDRRVLLTGASGGIGSELAGRLAARGARLLLVGREPLAGSALRDAGLIDDSRTRYLSADITSAEGRAAILSASREHLGGVDLLINGAGLADFAELVDADPQRIEAIFRVNTLAPVLLTQAVLPQMLAQGSGRIVNIGSVFGSIGFGCFAAYASSKFALRGFTESLRRELDGSGVSVSYLAPRAVKTAINSPAVYRMAEATGMAMDEQSTVAEWLLRCIERDRKDAYYGRAENFFIKLNGLLPRLVDRGLRKQTRVIRRFAAPAPQA